MSSGRIRMNDLATKIDAAGLAVDQWLGDWLGHPFAPDFVKEIIPIADPEALLRRRPLRLLVDAEEAARLAAPELGIEAAAARAVRSCVPVSTIRPWSITTSRSSAAMVDSRWAMAITVLPSIRP